MQKNKIHKIFRNRFGHFRAGWRIVICLGIIIVCFVPVAGLLKIWSLLSPEKAVTSGTEEVTSITNIIFYIGLNIALVLGSWITLRWIDKRPYALLGLDFNFKAVKEFAKGFLLGFLNFLMIFLVLYVLGVIEIKLSKMNSALLFSMSKYFIFFTVAGIFEEILNRGYFFQALVEGTRIWIAVIVVSLIFVFGHASNTGFAWNNGVFFFIHGILYCLLYLLSRSIWVPAGFHLAWNWTQGPVFGLNVSGIEIKNTLIICESEGSELLSGGQFGAEGSIISIVVSVFFAIFILKSKWLKPSEFRLKLWQKYPAGLGIEPKAVD